MNIDLLGFDGVRSRLSEIKSKLGLDQESPVAEGEFDQALSGVSGSLPPLSGEIAPFNVNLGGVQLRPSGPNAELKRMIQAAAEKAGLDPVLFDALVQKESAYDPNSRSRAGAMGLTQLMPKTAESLGVRNPFDPVQNLEGGATYLANMMRRFGNLEHALAAYNAGPAAVEKFNGIPPYAETQKYVTDIMNKVKGSRR